MDLCASAPSQVSAAITRILLLAKHTSAVFESVIIKSPDTDVAVTCLCLLSELASNIFFLTGVGNKMRIINLKKIAENIGSRTCQALVGIHTFTGCDSTSAFYGKGKKKAFDLMTEKTAFIEAFIELGNEFTLEEATFQKLENFVCHLYGHGSSSGVDDVRYKVFCLAATSLPEKTMPPSQDAQRCHAKRANYQAAIMKRSLRTNIEAPSPVANGWYIKNGTVCIT